MPAEPAQLERPFLWTEREKKLQHDDETGHTEMRQDKTTQHKARQRLDYRLGTTREDKTRQNRQDDTIEEQHEITQDKNRKPTQEKAIPTR